MTLSSEVKAIEEAYRAFGVELFLVLREKERLLILLKIVVPKDDRKQGLGTTIMEDLTALADDNQLRMALTPATDFGATSTARLVRFYRRFGFKPNRDPAISEGMVREPRAANAGLSPEKLKKLGALEKKCIASSGSMEVCDEVSSAALKLLKEEGAEWEQGVFVGPGYEKGKRHPDPPGYWHKWVRLSDGTLVDAAVSQFGLDGPLVLAPNDFRQAWYWPQSGESPDTDGYYPVGPSKWVNPGMGLIQREPRPPRPPKGSPSWTQIIYENKAKLEGVLTDILGEKTRIEDLLGCGHWGCVFQLSTKPWVAKFSRDPTEGPIWSVLKEAIEDEGPSSGLLDGIARVKAIVQIKGGVSFRRKRHPLYLIVREDVVPVKKDYGWSDYSRELLEKFLKIYHPARFLSAQAIHDGKTPTIMDADRMLDRALGFLSYYRIAATEWHKSQQAWFKTEDLGAMFHHGGYHTRRASYSEKKELERRSLGRMQFAINRLQEFEFAQAIFQTLDDLFDREIYLRDVHQMNIGWRVHDQIDGAQYETDQLVIFDPGHTPTADDKPIPEIEL